MEHNYASKPPSDGSEKCFKITKYCSVPQCNNYYHKGLAFHYYPKNPDMKRSWEVALKLGKPASATMRVCEHFVPIYYFPGGKLNVYLCHKFDRAKHTAAKAVIVGLGYVCLQAYDGSNFEYIDFSE